ncbi:afadin [Solea solea]|uniref:afadin n=1 Tax=Solea solea TaxID=90069 RepID=UPI00272B9D08|nr:afadin [Solea solea]
MPEEEEREKLAKVIRQWNNNRLDLFEISQPDDDLDFHGVMRFYYEDHVEGNVATKCLRVCSNSSTHEIIETLSEKFRPDMKMLTESYSLYEIHDKKERKLDQDERPLIVQLNWNSDNREGRFVLKKDQESCQENCPEKEKGSVIQNFKRTLSRKDKKTDKSKTKAADDGSSEKPQNNSIYVSNHETKHGTEDKKPQRQAAADQSGLPLGIRVSDTSEEAFLSAVINDTNSSTVHFKLSPAYILYATGRFALQHHRSHGSPLSGRTRGVTLIANKMVAMTRKVIQKQQTIAGALAFWMANSSELLNFFKHDKDLSLLTQQSQLDLSHLVHRTYSCLLQCLHNELTKHLPTFLIDPEQHGNLPARIEMVLNTLMNAMSLLRRCRVSPALTIQLFSQLFHFISAWLFNQLISPEASARGLRSHYWGAALRQRLTAIEAWAERQGLELAADCHLGHLIQATTLLTMNKYSMQDAKDIQTTCFKLNSVQLQMLLAGYLHANTEPQIPSDLIDAIVTAAEASADSLIRSEGRNIQLEESLDLHLPFLLPEGGYSCDTVRGIPQGLREFMEPICQKGLCSLTSQPNSKGDWTVFFRDSNPLAKSTYLAVNKEPKIVPMTLKKPLNSGMGVSIVAAKGSQRENLGIYIKSIVKGGPAEMNGGLTAGDQLLSVDGQSLVGLSQERAAAIMLQTGPVVTLQVAKFAANYHGLGTLLSEPAPDRNTGRKKKMSFIFYVLHDLIKAFHCCISASEQIHGRSRRNKEQIMQRNRQLYRSNPNMTSGYTCTDSRITLGFLLISADLDRDEPVVCDVRENTTSVSSINLYIDTFHRDYMTLPTKNSQHKETSESSRPLQHFVPLNGRSAAKNNFMRQALSQENLYMESGRPLLDTRQNMWGQQDWTAKQTMSHSSSFPIRSSISTHDILSDVTSPKTPQQRSRPSGAGVWRTPFPQHSTPTPSTQPIRIDIPITRAVNAQSKSPLITFQSSSVQAEKMRQTLIGHKQGSRNHIYAIPISAAKKLPPPSLSSQQHRPSIFKGQAVKPQVSITPTKHVSFQEPPIQQKQATGPKTQEDPLEPCDPWKRETQEKLEKQRRLQAVELLEREVEELQAKVKRSVEENERLRKLSLEWQFQKRLREIQQRGEDEDEDEDESLGMMVMIQQLGTRAQSKENSGGHTHKYKEEGRPTGNHVSQNEDEANTGQQSSGHTEDVHDVKSKENHEERTKSATAPEKLTFRERQRLFALASSA